MSDAAKSTLAVALYYEKGKTAAPRVVAKGRGEVGHKIMEVARAHGVPLEENAGLAEALSQVELDAEIPEALYKAVAEVLIYVMRVSGKL